MLAGWCLGVKRYSNVLLMPEELVVAAVVVVVEGIMQLLYAGHSEETEGAHWQATDTGR